DTLRHTPIHIVDWLGAPRLGAEADGEVWLNANAAGWGWSLGTNPASGRMDLLTVVEHEFGHVLFGPDPSETGLMEDTLQPGVRLFPGSDPVGASPVTTSGPAARLSASSPSTLAESPVITSGLTATPSAAPATLSNPAALAPHFQSLVTVSPSTGSADL